MKITRETNYCYIADASDDELHNLIALLSFEAKDWRSLDRTLINDDGTFYTGLIPLLKVKGFDLEITDLEPTPKWAFSDLIHVDKHILENRELRDYQLSAVRKALLNGRGIIQSPTGSGKTEMAAAIIAHLFKRGNITSAVFITPSVFLMEQMADRFEACGLGKVTRVGGGYKFNDDNSIAVYVSDSALSHLSKDPNGASAQFIRHAEFLGLEEAHHAKSDSWVTVAEMCEAQMRIAFTATAYEDPSQWCYQDLLLIGLVGPVIFDVRSRDLRLRGFLADPNVLMLNCYKNLGDVSSWQSVYTAGIVLNKLRNNMMISIAASAADGGYKTMIFVGQKVHGHALAKACASNGYETVFVHGGGKSYIYKPSGNMIASNWGVTDIAAYVNERDSCILICTSVLDEGLDVPVINCLIMGTGLKKYRRTLQRVGRGMRPKEGMNKVFIFDFMDKSHFYLQKQSEYRLWTYEQEEYEFSTSVEETSETMGCLIDVKKLSSTLP